MTAGIIGLAATLALAAPGRLQLTSPEVKNGKPMSAAQELQGAGCNGKNLSPELRWTEAPEGTKSFALTVYDPDAPTGSGFWHWVVYDIPATARGLPAGGASLVLPEGARQGRNDLGQQAFAGACPPKGDKPHHYVFTLHAVKVEHLDVPADASPALIGFALHFNTLAAAKLTATYAR